MDRRHNERGGVLGFVIVGFVLTALLVGGVLLAKHQARIARDANTTTTQNQQNEASPNPSDSEKEPVTTNTDLSTSDTGSSLPVSGPSHPESLPSAGPTDLFGLLVVVASLVASTSLYRQSRHTIRSAAMKSLL